MNDFFTVIVTLIAGLGTLLYAFKLLSDNMGKVANKGLKHLFKKTSTNKLMGVGIGTASTAIIQSSAATTVMIVGFVNAGLMGLEQATAYIMGANIGTTITAQIVALQTFNIIDIAMALALVGIFINMFAKSERFKNWGLVLASLGLVFIGLKVMSSAMTSLKENQAVIHALASVNNPLLLFAIGILVTLIFQSSSAITSIIISMATAGLIIGNGGNAPLYLILGTNIGTCITAILSSIGASQNAKRAAAIHLMFSTFSSVLCFVLLLLFPGFNNNVLAKMFRAPATQLAMFHTFSKIISVAIFLPFTDMFVKLSMFFIKDKKVTEEKETSFVDDRMLNVPSIALSQTKKEIIQLGERSITLLKKSVDAFLVRENDKHEEITSEIKSIELYNKQITDFMIKVSAKSLSNYDEEKISAYHHVIGDFMRICEISDNVAKYTDSLVKDNIEFSDEAIKQIDLMMKYVNQMFKYSVEAFVDKNKDSLRKADEMEDLVDSLKKELVASHIKRLNEGKCKAENSTIFINLVGNLERCADHLSYVAHLSNGKYEY